MISYMTILDHFRLELKTGYVLFLEHVILSTPGILFAYRIPYPSISLWPKFRPILTVPF